MAKNKNAHLEEKLPYREALKRNFRAWKIWAKLRPAMFPACICSALANALSPYVTIWFSAQIIGELAGNRDPQTLLRLVLMTLASSALLTLLTGALNGWKNACADWMANFFLNSKYMNGKMLELDFADLDRQETYDLHSQIQQNSNWGGWGLNQIIGVFDRMLLAIFRVTGGIALTVSLFLSPVPAGSGKLTILNNPFFSLGIVAVMLLTVLLSTFFNDKAAWYFTSTSEESKFGNRLFGYSFRLASEENRRADLRLYRQDLATQAARELSMKTYSPSGFFGKLAKGPLGLNQAMGQAVSALMTGSVYLFVCLKSWAGAFGVGAVTQYIGAATNLFQGLTDFLAAAAEMRANGKFLEPVFTLLDMPNAMYQGSLTTEKRSDRQYEVEFRDVSFKYPDTDAWALRHVNLKFKVGSRLAVVGMNGSGKTTFIKLLCRLYDPTEGEILLNGIDIRKYRYDDYMNIFSIVFQDFQLLALPLGQNVAGAMDYDRERAKDCLVKAGFKERLEAMPQGLDTYLYKELDKGGVEVSGGEAQKIAIARALYKDAPFIILDEPTAALDPIAEAEIYSKFNGIAGDKTAIYISHRLSSCKFCDEIAVFHEGAVVQKGTHEALLADTAGKYSELWNAQAQYYQA